MRKLLVLLFIFSSFIVKADSDDYPAHVTFSTATLEVKSVDIKQATQDAFESYGWQLDGETDTSLIGDLKGLGKSKIEVNLSGTDTITIKYLTEHDREIYKFYRRLLSVKAKLMLSLLDCKKTSLNQEASTMSPDLVVRRNLVYAFYKYNWIIKSITASRVTASLPARGSMEADISGDGNVRIRHRDELEGEYTDENKDGYVRRIRSVFKNQQRRCAK